MPAERVSRRVALRLAAVAAAWPASLAGAGCSKHEPDTCNDVAGLPPDDVAGRVALAYQDRATDPAKACAGCTQWTAPRTPEACGGCKVLRGPIHPRGSCKVFAARG